LLEKSGENGEFLEGCDHPSKKGNFITGNLHRNKVQNRRDLSVMRASDVIQLLLFMTGIITMKFNLQIIKSEQKLDLKLKVLLNAMSSILIFLNLIDVDFEQKGCFSTIQYAWV
jgi:hypothetical protein